MDPYAMIPPCKRHRPRQAGCPDCRSYINRSNRRRRLALSRGETLSRPVAEVRAHLDELLAARMLLPEIAAAAGVALGTLHGVIYGERKWVVRQTADRIMAVAAPADAARPPRTNLIPAIGATRRVRALARLGWASHHVIAAGGSVVHRLDQIKPDGWVTTRVAESIARAYDTLSMTRGPSRITERRAEQAGWPPPLAWDDDTIDDPTATPADLTEPAATPAGFDEITVWQAVDGELTYRQLAADRATLVETVRRLARTMNDLEIAHHLRWPGTTTTGPDGNCRARTAICQIRNREGIPAAPRDAHPVPATRPGRRAAARRAA